MQRLAAAVIATALAGLITGCLNGTTTPGLKRCVRYFIVIGFVTECEEGPPWAGGVKPRANGPAANVAPRDQMSSPSVPTEPPPSHRKACYYVIPEPGASADPK